jgi:hypothetical protein
MIPSKTLRNSDDISLPSCEKTSTTDRAGVVEEESVDEAEEEEDEADEEAEGEEKEVDDKEDVASALAVS